MTREATSANDGIVTDVTGPWGVTIGVAVCACDERMKPRSALMRTPKVTEAIMIDTVEKTRLVDWLIDLLLLDLLRADVAAFALFSTRVERNR
jgi:hypothetical protein